DLDSSDAEFGCDRVVLVDRRGRVPGQGAVKRGGVVPDRRDRGCVQGRIDERSHAQKNVATRIRVRATASASERRTRASVAWAPSPPGPNRAVGIPASAMNAASAQ